MVKEETKSQVSMYTREQISTAEKYRAERDILMAMLASDKTYTLEEINQTIEEFKKKPIKEIVNGGKR